MPKDETALRQNPRACMSCGLDPDTWASQGHSLDLPHARGKRVPASSGRCCCSRTPEGGWLMKKRDVFPTVLEAGSPRGRCGHRQGPSCCVSRGEGGRAWGRDQARPFLSSGAHPGANAQIHSSGQSPGGHLTPRSRLSTQSRWGHTRAPATAAEQKRWTLGGNYHTSVVRIQSLKCW